MLGQPIGLGVLLVNIDLCAVDGRVGVGVAVNADKVVCRPGIGQVDPALRLAALLAPRDSVGVVRETRAVNRGSLFKSRARSIPTA